MIEALDQAGTGELPEVMTGTLDVMAGATNYRAWLIAETRQHVRGRALEIGSGTGTMTDGFPAAKSVTGIEFDAGYVDATATRFSKRPDIRILRGDASDRAFMASLDGPFDSAFSFNVFEHIADDLAAMQGVHSALHPGGTFVCFVPACPSIYGRLDAYLGHQRRYTRRQLIDVATQAGFRVIDAYYFNLVGYFAWGFLTRVLRATALEEQKQQVGLFDRLVVPIARALQKLWRPPFGQSLVLVAVKLN